MFIIGFTSINRTMHMNPLIIIVFVQLLFTGSDVIARSLMLRYGFTVSVFFTPSFFLYFTIRQIAMIGQLYIFSTIPLGKTMALFAAVSIVLANVLGFLFFKEILTLTDYLAISFVIMALIIFALK